MAQKCICTFQTIEKCSTCPKLALNSTNEEEYFMKMNINSRYPIIVGVIVLVGTLQFTILFIVWCLIRTLQYSNPSTTIRSLQTKSQLFLSEKAVQPSDKGAESTSQTSWVQILAPQFSKLGNLGQINLALPQFSDL